MNAPKDIELDLNPGLIENSATRTDSGFRSLRARSQGRREKREGRNIPCLYEQDHNGREQIVNWTFVKMMDELGYDLG